MLPGLIELLLTDFLVFKMQLLDVEALGWIGIYLFRLVCMRRHTVEILDVSDLHLPNVLHVLRSVTYES